MPANQGDHGDMCHEDCVTHTVKLPCMLNIYFYCAVDKIHNPILGGELLSEN